MDLPDLARRNVSEELVAALAQTMHERPQQVWTSLSAAIPTVMWLYAEKASTPDGADELAAASLLRGPKILEQLPESFGGEPGRILLGEGQTQFTALFNRDATDAVSHAISSFSGMSINNARLMVGATHVIALTSLRRESRAENGRELARFLWEGRPSIAAAIPMGLHEHLDSIPRLHQLVHPYDDGVPATAGDDLMEGEAVIHRQETAPSERYYAPEAMDRVPGPLVWAIPVLVALAVGAAMVFTIYPRNADNPVAVTPTNPPVFPRDSQAQPAGAALPGPQALRDLQLSADPALTRDMADQIERFTRTLREARTSASIPEVTSTFTNVNQELGGLLTRFQRLPLEEQQRLGAIVSQILPGVQSRADETMNSVGNAHVRMQINDVLRVLRQFTQQPV